MRFGCRLVVAGLGVTMALSASAQAPATEQNPGMTTPAAQQPQRGRQRPTQLRQQPGAAENTGEAGTKREGATPAPPPKEETVVTHHSAKIGGQVINYTATAGTLIIKADNGTPKATFFYVAYTKDGVSDPASRPVSFVYNGGRGRRHMHLEPPFRKNIAFDYYEAGHMVYIDQKAHDKMHKDVDAFIESSYEK